MVEADVRETRTIPRCIKIAYNERMSENNQQFYMSAADPYHMPAHKPMQSVTREYLETISRVIEARKWRAHEKEVSGVPDKEIFKTACVLTYDKFGTMMESLEERITARLKKFTLSEFYKGNQCYSEVLQKSAPACTGIQNLKFVLQLNDKLPINESLYSLLIAVNELFRQKQITFPVAKGNIQSWIFDDNCERYWPDKETGNIIQNAEGFEIKSIDQKDFRKLISVNSMSTKTGEFRSGKDRFFQLGTIIVKIAEKATEIAAEEVTHASCTDKALLLYGGIAAQEMVLSFCGDMDNLYEIAQGHETLIHSIDQTKYNENALKEITTGAIKILATDYFTSETGTLLSLACEMCRLQAYQLKPISLKDSILESFKSELSSLTLNNFGPKILRGCTLEAIMLTYVSACKNKRFFFEKYGMRIPDFTQCPSFMGMGRNTKGFNLIQIFLEKMTVDIVEGDNNKTMFSSDDGLGVGTREYFSMMTSLQKMVGLNPNMAKSVLCDKRSGEVVSIYIRDGISIDFNYRTCRSLKLCKGTMLSEDKGVDQGCIKVCAEKGPEIGQIAYDQFFRTRRFLYMMGSDTGTQSVGSNIEFAKKIGAFNKLSVCSDIPTQNVVNGSLDPAQNLAYINRYEDPNYRSLANENGVCFETDFLNDLVDPSEVVHHIEMSPFNFGSLKNLPKRKIIKSNPVISASPAAAKGQKYIAAFLKRIFPEHSYRTSVRDVLTQIKELSSEDPVVELFKEAITKWKLDEKTPKEISMDYFKIQNKHLTDLRTKAKMKKKAQNKSARKGRKITKGNAGGLGRSYLDE